MAQEENREDPWLHAARRWGPRVQAKALYEMVVNGRSSSELAERNPDFASYKTYDRLLKHFQLYGEIPHQTEARKHRNRNKMYIGNLSIPVQNILLQRARSCPTSYLHEYQGFLEINGHGWYSVNTISRFLRSQGLTRAVLLRAAIQQDAFRQQQFLDQVSCIPSLDMFIMVDETHKDRKAGSRAHGWGPKGSLHLVMEVFNDPYQTLYTLIAAADCNGFVEEACYTVLRPETVTAETKRHYIRNYLLPVLGSFENNEPRSVVTMDNAAINEKLEIERMIHSVGAIILWNAPFSPQYHPIERAFKDYKDSLKCQFTGSWYDRHLSALRNIGGEKLTNYMCSAWGFDNYRTNDSNQRKMLQITLLIAVFYIYFL